MQNGRFGNLRSGDDANTAGAALPILVNLLSLL
jgi:hypothetical protein